MEACIKFNAITGEPTLSQQVIPVLAAAISLSYLPEESKITYVDAINLFMLSTYSIKNAWLAERKPQCHKKSTQSLGLFKRFQKFSKVIYIDKITFNNLQGYVANIHGTVRNGTLNKHIARFRSFLEFCVNITIDGKTLLSYLKHTKLKRLSVITLPKLKSV